MATVALIGPDGAGKTTLARMLEASTALRCRYLYMGVDISASNVALPTSRAVEWLRSRSGAARQPAGPQPSRDGRSAGRRSLRSAIRAWLRLGNRVAEEVYRQLVAWVYQLRGYVVLYDRHFIFDFDGEIEADKPNSLDRRLHRRFLGYLYPQPDLVLFLDAPGSVLYHRKGESTVAELERRRQAYLRQGSRLPNFVAVDATRPLEEVYEDILSRIRTLRRAGPERAVAGAR